MGLKTARRSLNFEIQSRDRTAWALDIAGLLAQGLVVPFLQTIVLAKILTWMMPDFRGSFAVSPVFAFCLSFIGIDYLYYWNHRLLHTRRLWPLHRVHHSVGHLDVLATSRNSAWTIFFIVYLWVPPLFVFFLKDPRWFLAGMVTGYCLDVWRHSGWLWNRKQVPVRLLRSFLIDAQDHEWHHAEEKFNINFGANLNLWDRMHGTFHRSPSRPRKVGVRADEKFWRSYLAPWKLP